MFCPGCGAENAPADFCSRCGNALTPHALKPPWQPPQPPTPPPQRSLAPFALVGAAAGVVIVLLAIIIFILHNTGRPDPSTAANAAPTVTVTPPPPTPASRTDSVVKPKPPQRRSPPTSTGPGDVRGLPAGLFCRDLYAHGYSYSAAVDYWRMHGQPNQMDADRNGVPCETVYPLGDQADYWGTSSPPATGIAALPAGLFCRDLDSQGYSYGEAVEYWALHGEPDQMDADLNGIPCETVYSPADVAAYWYD
jgi:hypothetical protein